MSVISNPVLRLLLANRFPVNQRQLVNMPTISNYRNKLTFYKRKSKLSQCMEHSISLSAVSTFDPRTVLLLSSARLKSPHSSHIWNHSHIFISPLAVGTFVFSIDPSLESSSECDIRLVLSNCP